LRKILKFVCLLLAYCLSVLNMDWKRPANRDEIMALELGHATHRYPKHPPYMSSANWRCSLLNARSTPYLFSIWAQ